MRITNAQVNVALNLLEHWGKEQKEAIRGRVTMVELGTWVGTALKDYPPHIRKLRDKSAKLREKVEALDQEIRKAIDLHNRTREKELAKLAPELSKIDEQLKVARLEVRGSILSGTPLSDILAKLGINL